MTQANSDLFTIRRPSVRDRLALGKTLRQKIRRSSLAEFKPTTGRRLAIDILADQSKTRNPDLIPIRHARMRTSPFAFFRGSAALMAQDLSETPSPAIQVQLCGDMHVSNFGFFASSEHRLVFGINDFDETLPGNFDWDLKRLVASAVIASEALGQDAVYAESIVRAIVTSYRKNLDRFSRMHYFDLGRSYIDGDALLAPSIKIAASSRKHLEKLIRKARSNTSVGVLDKFTVLQGNERRIIDKPPLVMHADKTHHGHSVSDLLDHSLRAYRSSLLSDRLEILNRYRLVDCARQVVGIGSVGLACWVMLMEGVNAGDPLILQYKEVRKSVLAPYFKSARYKTQGARVERGQRLIQGAPDLFLGYGKNFTTDFYIRQLRNMKGGISVGEDGIGVKEFPDYARLFGWSLAQAHARTGDPAILAGYCGRTEQLDDAMVRFAFAYAEQNMADYEQFCKAIGSGQLVAATENF